MAMAAGWRRSRLMNAAAYEQLEALSAKLAEGLAERAAAAKVPVQVNRVGSMLTVFFSETAGVRRGERPRRASTKRFGAFFHAHARRAASTCRPRSSRPRSSRPHRGRRRADARRREAAFAEAAKV